MNDPSIGDPSWESLFKFVFLFGSIGILMLGVIFGGMAFTQWIERLEDRRPRQAPPQSPPPAKKVSYLRGVPDRED